MSPIDFDPAELPGELEAAERAELSAVSARLVAARPFPSAGFRGELRRETLGRTGALHHRPPRLRRRVVAFLAAGAMLVVLAGSGLSGSGPFAPPGRGLDHSVQSQAQTQTP